jgi:hypothetical protein
MQSLGDLPPPRYTSLAGRLRRNPLGILLNTAHDECRLTGQPEVL